MSVICHTAQLPPWSTTADNECWPAFDKLINRQIISTTTLMYFQALVSIHVFEFGESKNRRRLRKVLKALTEHIES